MSEFRDDNAETDPTAEVPAPPSSQDTGASQEPGGGPWWHEPPGPGQWPAPWAGHPGSGAWPGSGWGWGPPGGWVPPPGHAGRGGEDHRRKTWFGVGAALITVLALLLGVGIGYSVWRPASAPSSSAGTRGTRLSPRAATTTATKTASNKTSTAAGGPSETAIRAIAAAVDPGLVDVNTVLGYQTAEAAGTGMVLTSTGEVLTNNHVIEGSTSISVTDLGNHQTYSATVVGYDRTLDVSVIQLKNASGLQTVDLGNSSKVSVGEAVVGIGNAGGTGGTPTTAGGSVTALNQAITASDEFGGTTEHLVGLIESNAHIEPGDSGGPLVDTSDQVVGMDTAASAAQGFSFEGAATGQGYSIPIDTAVTVAKQIEAAKGSSTVHIGATGFLGVAVEPVRSTRSGLGFGAGTPTATPSSSPATTTGALVAGVFPNTPAKQAGLAQGDVITSLAGTSVATPDALTKVIEQYHPGDKLKVVWTTPSGASDSATVTLINGPAG